MNDSTEQPSADHAAPSLRERAKQAKEDLAAVNALPLMQRPFGLLKMAPVLVGLLIDLAERVEGEQ